MSRQAASPTSYGRKVFVWDNYPVNDYGQTAGRLLLAPYQKREAGLSDYIVGIVSNPMNQAAASKVALFTIADFTWNDRPAGAGGYSYQRSWQQAARYLASGDQKTADALLTFFDLNHLAPMFGPNPWVPQSPNLGQVEAQFRKLWDAGQYQAAVDLLRPSAKAIAEAPGDIRNGVHDAGSGWRRLVFGSVAERVVRHSPCPVLTIMAPAEASE